jgi:transmembrane sensor
VPRWYDMRQNWRPMAASAAALIAVVAGGLEFSRHASDHAPQVAANAGAPAMQVFEAPSNGGRDVALADGTHMTLAPAARVRVDLAGTRRKVALDRGAVTLAVAHDATRPFQVTAQGRRIIDVGTRFKVAVESDAVRVALYEGALRIEGGSKTTVLRPGEQLVAYRGKPDVVTRIPANDEGGAELIQLDNVTLAAAAQTINHGSTLKLAVPDPRIAQLRVSGRFRASDPERFARSVSALLSLRVVRVSSALIELRRTR